MYDIVKLVFKSYMPKKLEIGMLFLIRDRDGNSTVKQLSAEPFNEENYIAENGYPVEPYLIDEGNPNLNNGYVVATPEQIGWWDEGEHSDELHDISIKEYNRILEEDEGDVCIELECENCEDYDVIVPSLYDGKVTLRSLTDVQDEDEEDDDEYESDDDDDEYEYYEDYDDEEDEGPEYDGAGFTYEDNFNHTETQFAPTEDEGAE